ncbi:uncharacterized protein LOC129585819 isoform X2 [Paramacrobiotus metropolitanus]|uniref:uncharacterized protein LOC129585819 isoform X2 n=1 Tax=Paramacrobiotus metropolitanus TaxID=2943436 RepID=UPI0024462B49|nr:uncharacterized protein LOC129585819 isoform X2 [Paramacrobiotus metropolitanus]
MKLIQQRDFVKSNETEMLMLAFRDFSDSTCVQFVPRTGQRDYVFITTDPKRGCLSYIGWQGGRQEVFLLRPNCFYLKGTIIHELMHTIGFYHEHSRPDRDDHVQVVWNNIRADKLSNFQIEQSGNTLGVPYDYSSVMHYSALTFSKDPDDKEYTMIPKNMGFPPDRLGQRRGFSAIDLQQILVFYNCPKRLMPFIGGFVEDHPGFPDPSEHTNPEDTSKNGKLIPLVRQARNEDISTVNHENDVQAPQFIVAGTPSTINVDVPVLPGTLHSIADNNAPQEIIQPPTTSSAVSVCSGFFAPDAVLNFLGFFYLFKDGLYWKYSYLDGAFTKQPNFPKAYKANFNADIPNKLDSVFSYLTYIYFVKDTMVWVAKSDSDIRGPVALKKLFPGLPDISWDNIFVKGTIIHFISRASTWLYDIRSDKIMGPLMNFQNPLFLSGPVTELPDGRMLAFPTTESIGDGTHLYMLDRLSGQTLPGFPRSTKETFC